MFDTTRRKLYGAGLLGAGVLLGGLGFTRAENLATRGRILLDAGAARPMGLVQAANFPLIEAIHGRRSRRFAKGAAIPNGPLAFTSRHAPEALDPLEQMLLIATVAGNTGWAELFAHHPGYAGRLPNYTTAAGGRSFPSSAGFSTSEFFFTDDTGVYFLPTRDMTPAPAEGGTDLRGWLDAHRARIVKLADGRLNIPAEMPHMEGHNTWCANVPGSTLVFPVADVAQHVILQLLYLVQNGTGIYDDVNGRQIPGLERYTHRLNLEVAYPLTFLEQIALSDVSVEMGTACYAGALMLQALGLGGWMYTGINPFTVMGASGNPAVPGLGFRFDMLPGNPLPHFTGLPGIFEAHVPPHHASMRAAVETVVARKFGAGGPFDPKQGGSYRENAAVRSSAAPIDAEAIEIATVMSEYVFSTFGRFPATVPAVFLKTYLQAHRLDTEFYDRHHAPGAYLRTHARHDRNWG
ncbi:hypothetical protein [Sabulicella glaciei]|uniref:Uncharacterized protein n=1 Tax=Sabulicella glaciei TaxID=2984948 RepID=A0ABT3NY95_9PROT|nr:hypothetical protein [Roseococcus sp. MDT2-1-1]MCW8086888.1 hypothetical protein [Roseococcus sp. MDT2-1-1]